MFDEKLTKAKKLVKLLLNVQMHDAPLLHVHRNAKKVFFSRATE